MSATDAHNPPSPPPPLPPAASQSHFSQFENFIPDDDASFDHEFARLASSQHWVPGSQEYAQERTIAMRQELKLHYFSQTPAAAEGEGAAAAELTEEEKLRGYQDLCREVRIPPADSVAECRKHLKSTLVNIVDLIDARRVRREVQVWQDFEAFREYTLQDGHRVNMVEAKRDGGYLASLLQNFRKRRARRSRADGRRRKKKNGRDGGCGVVSGRVIKEKPAVNQTDPVILV